MTTPIPLDGSSSLFAVVAQRASSTGAATTTTTTNPPMGRRRDTFFGRLGSRRHEGDQPGMSKMSSGPWGREEKKKKKKKKKTKGGVVFVFGRGCFVCLSPPSPAFLCRPKSQPTQKNGDLKQFNRRVDEANFRFVRLVVSHRQQVCCVCLCVSVRVCVCGCVCRFACVCVQVSVSVCSCASRCIC